LAYNSRITGKLFPALVYLFALTIPISIVAGQFAAILLLLCSLLLIPERLGIVKKYRALFISFAIFLVVFLISAGFAQISSEAVPQLKKSWVLLCLFPLILLESKYSRIKTANFLIIGIAISSLISLFRYFTGSVDRAAPYSGGYTTLAVFAAAAIPILIARYSVLDKTGKIRYIAVLAVIAGALIFSKTRAGWVAGFVGAAIVGFGLNWRRALLGIVAVAVIVVAIPQTRNIVLQRFESNKPGGITSGRSLLFESAMEPLRHLPFFGYGPGSFQRLIPPDVLERIGDRHIKSWHSTPLEILLESGPVALAAFLALAALPLISTGKRIFKSGPNRYHSLGGFASLVALYLAGLTTNLMRDFMLLSLLTLLWSVYLTDPANSSDEIAAANVS